MSKADRRVANWDASEVRRGGDSMKVYVHGVVSLIHDGVQSELPSRLEYGHVFVVLQPCEGHLSLTLSDSDAYPLSQRFRGAPTYKPHKIKQWQEC